MIQGLKLRRFLTAFLLFAVCTLSWAYDFVADDIYYNINSDGSSVSVTYKNNRYSGVVNIPSSVLYDGKQYSVTSIGDRAFFDCSGLTSITIPNSVKSIGDRAFFDCSGLTSITIPNNVTSIGDRAFFGCSGLTSITIPNNVTSIGGYAFYNCSGLTSITIPNNVTSIGGYAFYNCNDLTSVTINSNSIVAKTYSSNSSIAAIFGTQVTKYIIGDGVTSIGGGAFSGCSGLTSVTIPKSVTSIGYYAFSGCKSLTSVTIPNSVTSIANGSFYNCSGLTSVTIPNSVTSIGYGAFFNCSGLTSITIPNNVTSIGDEAFYGCSGLTSITIPESVTSIGREAFYECSGLTSIIIPNSVTSIGSRTFYGCSGLTSVTIPNNVTSIGYEAFYGCSGLTSVTIPNSVTSIGGEAFSGCSGLTSISVEKGNKVYDSRNNCNAIIHTETNTLFAGFRSTVIPNSVTSIGDYAFENCSSMTSITIPNSVTSIGDHAFQYCSSLTSIAIPNSVKSIGISAFENCSNLTSITIPNSVTSIGKSVFEECFSLASVILPNGITDIGSEFFKGCPLTSFTIPSSVTSIDRNAFEFCSSLKEVYCLAEQVPETDIDAFHNASMASATLYVPASAIYAYKAAAPWSDFGKIMPLPYDFETDGIYFKINTDETTVIIYSIGNNSGSLVVPSTVTYNGKQYIVTGIGDNAIPTNTQIYVDKGASALIAVWNYGRSPYDLSTNTLLPIPTISKTNNCASSLQLLGASSSNGVQFTNESFTVDGVTKAGHSVTRTGLRPDTSYPVQYSATVTYGGSSSVYTRYDYFKTSSLLLTLSTPKVVSLGNVIVAATSNLDDDEGNAGFEWRRMDWPDEILSNSGVAYLYEGTMEGYIRNLNTNYYWKVRPYYKANDGTYYYGEWGGFDPTNTSYFEPTVHTYARINVTGNKAQVSGYVQRASDAVSKQGFKYWVQEYNARGSGISIPSSAKTVEAEGRVMEVELTGLEPNTTYSYVAFVTTTEGDTFYGKQLSFTTGDDPDATIVGDANCNGEVEIGDVTSVLTLMATPEATGYDKKAADANGNGEIEIGDVTTILTIMANGE